MLWKIKYWGDIIIAESAVSSGMYSNSLLYIDRKNKTAFIVNKKNGISRDDWKEILAAEDTNYLPEEWSVIEKMQDTFYGSFKR